MDIAEIKIVQIRNFSHETVFRDDNTHFVIKRNNIPQIFCVIIYRNGETSTSRGYVSASITKMLREVDAQPGGVKDSLSWTFSVVDVNGVGKYYQSFVKENVAYFPYEMTIPKLLERAFILEQYDEFLPDDVLTLRIELSCMSYMGPSIQKDISVEIEFLKDANVTKKDGADSSGTFMANQLECDSNELFIVIICVLRAILMARKRSFIDAVNEQLHKDLLLLFHRMDYIQSMYLSSNPIFQLITFLKRKLVKELNGSSHYTAGILAKEEHNLQKLEEVFNRMKKLCETPGIQFIISKLEGVLPSLLSWTVHIKNIDDGNPVRNENLSVREECISEKEDVEEKMENNMNEHSLKINNNKYKEISEVNPAIPKVVEELSSKTVEITCEKSTKEEQNQNTGENKCLPQEKDEITMSRKSVDKIKSTSFNNDIDFIKEIIFNLMAEERKFFADEYSENDNKNKWNLNVETMDGVQFAIPFENGKETFGSKLVACSPVFQAMLKHPMQERFHKMVKILDIDSKTFINFLDYLKSGVFKEESLSGVFNLYRFGDKYIIKDLMRICADKMVPFFSLKSTDALEMMANMHSDEYLLQLVESFKNKSMNSDASHPKTDEASNVYRNHFEENESERYREFDFYH